MAQKNFTAIATGAISGPVDAGAGNNFRNFSLKVSSAVPNCIVALETSPDNATWTEQDRVTGPNWAYVAMHHARRYARANVINLGTPSGPVAATICYTS